MADRAGFFRRARELVQTSGVPLGLARTIHRGLRRFMDVVSTAIWRRRLLHCGRGTQIQRGVHIEYPRLVSVGDGCLIQRRTKITSESRTGRLELGDGVQINEGVHLDHTGGLFIGSGTLVSEGVLVYTHSHGLDPRSQPVPLPKEIGSRVWLGSRVLILERCTSIGNNAVIGAGAVVAKSVPPDVVAFGNPCIIRAKHSGG